jgi:hypothetical protein
VFLNELYTCYREAMPYYRDMTKKQRNLYLKYKQDYGMSHDEAMAKLLGPKGKAQPNRNNRMIGSIDENNKGTYRTYCQTAL